MKRKAMACAAGLLAGLLCSVAATAQTYPTKTVKIIVPYQAGQGTDVAARYFAEQLSKALGQVFYVDNKPGAGGNIGTEATARSAPDGYTLMMGTNATQTMNEFLYPSTGYDSQKDFAPIILVGMLPMVISANPSFPANSIGELIAAAKAKPDKIDMALPSTTARIVFELLTEVTGGQVQTIIDTVTATRGHVTAGKLKALGITTLKSSALLPGVKSVAEQGVPGFEMTAWNAFYAPAGTPKPIVDLLNAEVTKILAQPDTQQRLLGLGFEPAGGTPESLAKLEVQECTKWAPLIKAAGLKGE